MQIQLRQSGFGEILRFMGSVQLFIEQIVNIGNQNTWRSQLFESENNDVIPKGILYLLVCMSYKLMKTCL